MEQESKFQKLFEKIQKLKESKTLDLSLEEDLSLAVMNLISLEEHFFFTASKTGQDGYFDLLSEVREMRKIFLARLIPKSEGETWCIAKHLLAATMRLIEVGTKYRADGKQAEAKESFASAYRCFAFFWGLRLKLLDVGGIKKVSASALNVHDQSKSGRPWSAEDIVSKLVDCCRE